MTDETPSKPVWIRHPGCQQLVFNEPLNINAHKIACPYDIKKSAQLLEERVVKLEGLLKSFTDAPAEAPAPALDSIGSWDEVADDEPVQESTYVADEVAAYPESTSPTTSDDWDDEDEEPSTVSPLR